VDVTFDEWIMVLKGEKTDKWLLTPLRSGSIFKHYIKTTHGVTRELTRPPPILGAYLGWTHRRPCTYTVR